MWEQGGFGPFPLIPSCNCKQPGFPYQELAVSVLGDNSNYNASGVVLYGGGNYNQNQNNGAFYLNGNNAASNKNANRGAPYPFRSLGIVHRLIRITSCD